MNLKIKTAVLSAISAGALAGVMFASAQSAPACYQFTRNLSLGASGADVKALQQALNSKGFQVAASGAGSPGMETSYFGGLTKTAVIAWQNANSATVLAPWGLSQGTGFFGSSSRGAMNACSGNTNNNNNGNNNGGTVTNGSVSVSLSSSQPNNVLVQGQAHAKLADFTFTGTGIVTNVKLSRTGVSNNSALTNVYLYDGMTKLTDAASVLADGTINFNSGVGLFSVTGSKTISVYADIAGSTSGQSVGVALTGFTLSGSAQAAVSGLNGPSLPIGAANLATAKIATTSNQTQANVGDTNINIWSAGITIGDHNAWFNGASFRVNGSAASNALSNVKLYIDGVQVGNATNVDSNSRISFAGNVALNSGYHTLNVRADVANGAGDYVTVTLDQGSDILIQDAQLMGAYITPTDNSSAAINNWSGQNVNIQACQSGSSTCVIFTQDSTFIGNAASVTVGASNQVIGKFNISASGEPIKLQSATLDVKLAAGGVSTDAVTNVTVYVNGMAVSSGATIGLGTGSSSVALSNLGNIIVNPGQAASIEVRADLRNPNGTNIGNNNIKVTISNLSVQGQQSRNITSAPTQTSLQAVVNGSSATFTQTSSFSAIAATPNQQNVKIGSFTMSTGNSEGANVTQVDVTLAPSAGFDLSQISSITLNNGSQSYVRTVGSGTATTTSSFSLYDQVNSNSSKVYDVWANFSNASGSVAVSGKGYWTGQTTNTLASSTVAAVSTSFSNATLATTTLNSNSSKSQFVTSGSQMTSNFLVSSANAVNLTQVELKVSNAAAVAGVTVNGQTAISQGSGHYLVNLTSPIAVNSGFGSTLPVVVTFSPVTNTNSLSNTTTVVSLTYLGTDNANAYAGTSGAYTAIAGAATSNTFTSAIAIPTSVQVTSGSTINNGTAVKLGTITVQTNGTIKLNAIPFNIAVAQGGSATSTSIVLKNGGSTVTGTYASGVYTITSGDIVSGTVSYDVYGDVTGMTQSGSVSLSLGAPGSFSWNDSANNFTGTPGIANYGN